MSKSLAELIREARESRALNQTELAKLIDVTSASVSWWEKGGRPRFNKLKAIAKHTRFPLKKLADAWMAAA